MKFGKDENIIVKTKNLKKGKAYKRNDFRDIHNLKHPIQEY